MMVLAWIIKFIFRDIIGECLILCITVTGVLLMFAIPFSPMIGIAYLVDIYGDWFFLLYIIYFGVLKYLCFPLSKLMDSSNL